MAGVAKFGGKAGGRPRNDGLVPGSPEAINADRDKETRRKAAYRSIIRANNPPALPSALPAPGAPLPNQGQAVAGTQGVDPASLLLPLVLWTETDLKEFTDQLIPAAEQTLVKRLTSKAAKAKLAPPVLKDIEEKSRWDELTKKTLAISTPRLAAKWLNKADISAEYKDELAVSLCALRMWKKQTELEALLQQLIEKAKAEENPKDENEKKI